MRDFLGDSSCRTGHFATPHLQLPNRSLLSAVWRANQQLTAAGKLCARKMRNQKSPSAAGRHRSSFGTWDFNTQLANASTSRGQDGTA